MTLLELLKSRGFGTALIVDDAYEEAPTAADLTMEDDAWPNFMDDLRVEEQLIREIFPRFEAMEGPELRESDEFVDAMWRARGRLNADLWDTLFSAYERQRALDRGFLDRLKARLEAAGLQVVAVGRTVPAAAKDSDIIFADLFFGAAQRDFDVGESISRIRDLLEGRRAAPPPVVLMSSSGRLNDKKERFRDEAEMLGALFRVYQKGELLEGATVETVLERFATHHSDAVKVAAFVEAWRAGLEEATKRFMETIRRLDLSDYTNIRSVLLEAEGQPLGSYLLDVFDRVLQHEIEGHPATITAALRLNGINSETYPTPYIAGSPDLQNLVARTIWQHTERLKVSGNTAGMPVSLGDVLVRKAKLANAAAEPQADVPDALVVLTPACDLMRPGKRRVLAVGGSLSKLDHQTWRYKTAGAVTPIVVFGDGTRMSISWDLDDQRMLTRDELGALVADAGNYVLSVRLRESNALELQQRMLSEMGRVGLLSKLPFTFPVDVSFHSVEADGALREIELPSTSREGGVCITGRDSKEDMTRLILTEPAVDEVLRAIASIDPETVHDRSRDALARLKDSASFRTQLQRGLNAPGPTVKGKLQQLKTLSAAVVKEGEEQKFDIVGLIARNPGEIQTLDKNMASSAGIVVIITDKEPDAAIASEALTLVTPEAHN